jgi:putative hydrolase of the HAD superfamily
MIELVGLDADDTLWHNEPLFTSRREQFCALLARYEPDGVAEDRLYAVEMQNLRHFGYGVKGFVLSMIETAIEMTGGRLEAARSSAGAARCLPGPSTCSRGSPMPSNRSRGSTRSFS